MARIEDIATFEDYDGARDSIRVPHLGKAWLKDFIEGGDGGDASWMAAYVPDSGPPGKDTLSTPVEQQPVEHPSKRYLGEKAVSSLV